MKRLEYVAALRELADFVESKEFPSTIKNNWGGEDLDNFDAPKLSWWTNDRTHFGTMCAIMGSFEKVRTDYSTGAKKVLDQGAIVELTASREVVCRKVVIGTRTVEAKPERIVEAEPEHTEDIVEWECPESFISLAQGE